jgi:predicted transcriptional regulator
MTKDDEIIASGLDEHWRTVVQIRSRLGLKASQVDLTGILRRLAQAGDIERQKRETIAPARRGRKQIGNRAIELFRQGKSRTRNAS